MTLQRRKERTPEEYAAMFRFLDSYDNQTFSNDVGGLLGQLSMLREVPPIARRDDGIWRKAVSLAVTAH
jgi:hypothetical protein